MNFNKKGLQMNTKEVLIIRNTTVQRLYDVVVVNYFTEDVEFIVKGVQFEVAVEKQLEVEESFN
jgi:nucleoside diphosphate kinase